VRDLLDHRATLHFGRVRREDERDLQLPQRAQRVVVLERGGETLEGADRRGLAMERPFPAAMLAVELLGEVDELKVERERPDHVDGGGRCDRVDRREDLAMLGRARASAALTRERPKALDQLVRSGSRVRAQDVAEEPSEVIDPRPERRALVPLLHSGPIVRDRTEAAFLAAAPCLESGATRGVET
jgi:hypothetical protein